MRACIPHALSIRQQQQQGGVRCNATVLPRGGTTRSPTTRSDQRHAEEKTTRQHMQAASLHIQAAIWEHGGQKRGNRSVDRLTSRSVGPPSQLLCCRRAPYDTAHRALQYEERMMRARR